MEEKGLPSSLPQGEGGCKSRPHFKIAFFAYVYVYPVIFTGAASIHENDSVAKLAKQNADPFGKGNMGEIITCVGGSQQAGLVRFCWGFPTGWLSEVLLGVPNRLA